MEPLPVVNEHLLKARLAEGASARLYPGQLHKTGMRPPFIELLLALWEVPVRLLDVLEIGPDYGDDAVVIQRTF